MTTRLALLVLAVALSACDGGGAGDDVTTPPADDVTTPPADDVATPPAGGSSSPLMIALTLAGPPGLSAGSVTLVSSVRVNRTVFDYTYTVRATNGTGAALHNVTATVTSDAPTTVVTDSTLAFGDLAAGASATSSDTFTIRQDRVAPLAAANLTIALTGEPGGPAEGVLLQGQPGDPALAQLVDMLPIPAQEADIENRVLLTRLDVAIAADATVGQVNGALQSIGAGIIGMHAGLPALAIAVPRQTDAASLQALADTLSASPGIRVAVPGIEAVPDLAPPSPANAEAALRHLNDARFPAAWNVNRLAGDCSNRPTVLVADFFTRPIPGNVEYSDFGLEVPGVDANGIGGGGTFPNAGFHGYDVLTTLAAALDDEVPTGANPFPGCLDIRTVNVSAVSGAALTTAIATSLPASGKVVVNVSLAFDECSEPCIPAALNAPDALSRGLEAAWARHVLQPVADRVLVVAAAGNNADDDIATIYRGTGIADYNHTFTVAAKADPDLSFTADESLWEPPPQDCSGGAPCFPSLTITDVQRVKLVDTLNDLGTPGRTRATNVLVVGSTMPVTNLPSAFSEPGSDISAVGEGIPTMEKNAAQGFETTQGTSFSAPQVAALAAYLWMISPDLRNGPLADTVSAITANAGGIAGQIDAYATVLSLDPAGDPDPATWKVRRTLLDVSDDGQFTEIDIAAFIPRYFEEPDLEVEVQPASRDYSRFDLNGDGFTGGADRLAGFDLDRTGSVQFGAPVLDALELQVGTERREISEKFANDLDILCYYAYSALFQGSETERERLLANKCVTIGVVVTPAGATVQPGGTVNFAADVRGTTDPRVNWSVPGGGGAITAAGVFTAGSQTGTVTVRATSVVNPDAFGEATVEVVPVLTGQVTQTILSEFDDYRPVPLSPNHGTSRATISASITVVEDRDVVGGFTVLNSSGTYSGVTELFDLDGPCPSKTFSISGNVAADRSGTTESSVILQIDGSFTGGCVGVPSGTTPFSESFQLFFTVIRSQDGQSIVALDFNRTDITEPDGIQQLEARKTTTGSGRLEAVP